jgi:hypothetical protein
MGAAVLPIADPDAIYRSIRNHETKSVPRQAANRIAPRQKSKGLPDISNPFKRRSNNREIVVPHFEKASEPSCY